MSTLPTSNGDKATVAEACTRKRYRILKKFHFCGTLTLKTIVSAFLITVVLWLFARLPDPQIHLTSFRIDALNTTAEPPPPPDSTLIHYNFTIHNPDLYKSLYYDVLVLRITYIGDHTAGGATVNFDEGGKKMYQGPGQTKTLTNHSLDYSYNGLNQTAGELHFLKEQPWPIFLTFVMQVSFKAFNKVIATRQLTKNAAIHFDVNGAAIISDHGGLALHG